MDDIGFNSRVLRRRKLLGLSQKDLADRIGISQPAIKKIETGGQTRKGRALATALETTLQWLETGEDPATDPEGHLLNAPAMARKSEPSTGAKDQPERAAAWLLRKSTPDRIRALTETERRTIDAALDLMLAGLESKKH